MAWAIYCLAWGLFPHAWFSLIDPFHASFAAFLILMLLGWGAGLATQAARYRRAAPWQRAQTKWVPFVFAAACIGYAAVYLPNMLLPASGSVRLLYDLFGVPVFLLLALPIPVTLAIAMQRYHLFDVRPILHQTLVYAVLTGVLAFVYISSVVLLQSGLGGRDERGEDLPLTIREIAGIQAKRGGHRGTSQSIGAAYRAPLSTFSHSF